MTDTPQVPSQAEIQARVAMEMFALKAAVGVLVLLIVFVFAMVLMKISPDATEIGVLMAVITPTVGLAVAAFAYIYRSKQVPPTVTSPVEGQSNTATTTTPASQNPTPTT